MSSTCLGCRRRPFSPLFYPDKFSWMLLHADRSFSSARFVTFMSMYSLVGPDLNCSGERTEVFLIVWLLGVIVPCIPLCCNFQSLMNRRVGVEGVYSVKEEIRKWRGPCRLWTHKSQNKGRTSTDRSTKATLMLTVPWSIAKSSTEDSTWPSFSSAL